MYRFITEGGVDSSLYLLLLALAGLGGFIYKFLVTEIVLEQKALHYSSLWIEKRIRYQEIQKITIGSSPFASVDIYAKNRLWADVTVGGGVTDWPRFAYHLLGRVPSSTEVSGGEWIIEADSVDDLPGNRSK
jgi:hypothetical protein